MFSVFIKKTYFLILNRLPLILIKTRVVKSINKFKLFIRGRNHNGPRANICGTAIMVILISSNSQYILCPA